MLENKEYVYESLANHLYFAGSIRSFCSTIGLTFYKNNQDYIDRAITIGYQATDIINETILLMNNELAEKVLDSNVYITDFTKELDLLTERLFDIDLLIQIDKDIKILKSRKEIILNEEYIKKIEELNNKAENLINIFKNFCKEIKNKLDNNELFSYLYPDFFNYMYDEISVYGRDIVRIMSKKDYTEFYLNEFTFYFNELLRESALYIRGFLDTSSQDIFDMASVYVNAFANLEEKYLKNKESYNVLNNETEKLVLNYKSFLEETIKKLLNSQTYFITPPLTLDNFLTNANVYLFILKYINNIGISL